MRRLNCRGILPIITGTRIVYSGYLLSLQRISGVGVPTIRRLIGCSCISVYRRGIRGSWRTLFRTIRRPILPRQIAGNIRRDMHLGVRLQILKLRLRLLWLHRIF